MLVSCILCCTFLVGLGPTDVSSCQKHTAFRLQAADGGGMEQEGYAALSLFHLQLHWNVKHDPCLALPLHVVFTALQWFRHQLHLVNIFTPEIIFTWDVVCVITLLKCILAFNLFCNWIALQVFFEGRH